MCDITSVHVPFSKVCGMTIIWYSQRGISKTGVTRTSYLPACIDLVSTSHTDRYRPMTYMYTCTLLNHR